MEQSKPIFVITTEFPISAAHRADVSDKLSDYHLIFFQGSQNNCQLFSTKETIELTDLKQLQDYLDEHKS